MYAVTWQWNRLYQDHFLYNSPFQILRWLLKLFTHSFSFTTLWKKSMAFSNISSHILKKLSNHTEKFEKSPTIYSFFSKTHRLQNYKKRKRNSPTKTKKSSSSSSASKLPTFNFRKPENSLWVKPPLASIPVRQPRAAAELWKTLGSLRLIGACTPFFLFLSAVCALRSNWRERADARVIELIRKGKMFGLFGRVKGFLVFALYWILFRWWELQ